MTALPTNQILRGECIKMLADLPDNSIDAIITDPPYSSGGFTRGDRNAAPSTKYLSSGNFWTNFSGDNRDMRSWVLWCNVWLSECLRVAKDGAYIISFIDWRMLPSLTDAIQVSGFVWRGIIVWDKLNARPNPAQFRAQCEFGVWGTKGALRQRPIYPKGCFAEPINANKKFHLTGKPLRLMERIVAAMPEGSTILDPFAGSGTTLVAAKRLGYNYIGMEMSEHYAEVAQKRLDHAQRMSDEYIAKLRANECGGGIDEKLDDIDFGDIQEQTEDGHDE